MNIHKLNGFIYVTSEEEIIINDYYLAGKDLHKCISSKELEDLSLDDFCKKVILTNDRKLTNVQQLTPEEEAYCNTVDSVEVVDDTLTVGEMSNLPLGARNHKYKLQLPKQETIEEVAYNYAKNKTNRTSHLIGFREGYNEAVKTLYNDEEVKEILDKYNNHIQENFDMSKTILSAEKWFNQNKKK